MTVDETEVHRVLYWPTRLEVLTQLRSGPKTAGEIAKRLSIGQTTAKYHLLALIGAGMVSRMARGRERGRPKVYSLDLKMPLLTYPKRSYGSLSESIFRAFEEMKGEGAKKALWRIGHLAGLRQVSEVAEKHGVGGWTLDALRRHLLEEGVKEVTGNLEVSGEGPDGLTVRLYDCPVRELAERHPDCFCGAMEEVYRDGLVEATGGSVSICRRSSVAEGSPSCEFEIALA